MPRTSARVILLDEHGAVLLFCGSDPAITDGTAPRWWFTIGGEAAPGEPLAATAARELAAPATPGQPASPPEKPALAEKVDKSVLSLTPSLASSIQPTPEGSASPTAAAIGRLAWKIDTLPAGSYEVILHYASLDPVAAVPVVVEFADQKLEALIDKERATKNTRSYRLMRLGRLKLEKAASGDELVLTAGGTDSASLLVRNLHIAPASAP